VLYGYEQFRKKFATKKAQSKYEYLGHKDSITSWAGKDQRRFDPKRKQNGLFHLDHVYTLSMMKRAIGELSDNNLTVANIA